MKKGNRVKSKGKISENRIKIKGTSINPFYPLNEAIEARNKGYL